MGLLTLEPIQKGSQKPLNEDNIIRFLSEQDKINSPYFLLFLITTLLFLMHLFKGYSHYSDMPVDQKGVAKNYMFSPFN